MERDDVWAAARGRLRDELGLVRTDPWLGALTLRSSRKGGATLEAPDPEVAQSAERHLPAIERALAGVLGREARARVTVARRRTPGRADAPARPGARAPEPAPPEVAIDGEPTNQALELGSFLTGPANELPLRFAREAVEKPGAWNPIVFYGETGSGKTHLLHGIVNGYRRRYPARRVVYASSERFARQYSVTARRRQADRFRELYRRADLLVLDDVQDLAGKASTARELTFTLDHLAHGKRQVVVSCSTVPKRVADLEQALGDRLSGGLVVELRSPDEVTRRAILRARAAALGLALEPDVQDLLVHRLAGGARELLAALTRLDAHRRLLGGPLDRAAVHAALADLLATRREPATLDAIAELVAAGLCVAVDQLRGDSRRVQVARARQVAMGLSRELTTATLREVGAYFGRRSCTAVHDAHARVRTLRGEDERVGALWEQARARFAPRDDAPGAAARPGRSPAFQAP